MRDKIKQIFKDKNTKEIIAIGIGMVIIIVIIVISIINSNRGKVSSQEGTLSSEDDVIYVPDDSYFIKENEKKRYKLQTDKVETISGLTFYDFKMKDYKNGYQKFEINVRNDGTKASEDNKRFIIEFIDKNEESMTIMYKDVKSLNPGESTKLEGHFAGDIKNIENFRIKEYLLDD